MSKIYLICPVRNVSKDQLDAMTLYVASLERDGHTVHFPNRDVDQSNDDGGVRICDEHRAAMHECDEVHTFWDPLSYGSHFDLGMAFMLSYAREQMGGAPIRFVVANHTERVPVKSFQNVLVRLCESEDDYDIDYPNH
jgi:hypothetical protein